MDKRELFGVEIEIENCGDDHYEIAEDNEDYRWRFTEDGTLRNGGIELVSEGIQSQKSLAVIDEIINNNGWGEDNISTRCSSHIHVDTRNLNRRGIMMFALLLIGSDQDFFNIGGSGREKSLYCVPASSPITMLNVLSAVAGHGGGCAHDLKYCSINPMPLRRTGSIELRHFHPIMKTKLFVSITDMILELYDTAEKYQDKNFSKFFAADVLPEFMVNIYKTGALNYYTEEQ